MQDCYNSCLQPKLLTDFGSINVTKSIQKYPMIPLDLHDSAILKQALFRTSGSTEDCGIETPQQVNWDSAWIWSPQLIILVLPLGSINMSTVSVVMLSDGGQASITPPEGKQNTSKPLYNSVHYDMGLHTIWFKDEFQKCPDYIEK